MKGKFIVIEGVDGAGKETQSKIIKNILNVVCDKQVHLLSFPNHLDQSSYLVKQYLEGKFPKSENLDTLSYYKQISSFYTMDRVYTIFKDDGDISYFKKLKDGDNIICDRYTTSNIIHMAANLDMNNMGIDIFSYVDWIQYMEYNIFKLPKPDLVIFLDVSISQAIKNLENRSNTNIDNINDIHEKKHHQYSVNRIKDTIINLCGWETVNCMSKENTHEMLSKEEISKRIIHVINKKFNIDLIKRFSDEECFSNMLQSTIVSDVIINKGQSYIKQKGVY